MWPCLYFLYSDHLDLAFHIDAMTELCRVCTEVRTFPLLQLGATPYPYVQPVTTHFETKGYSVERVEVPYEFQPGGNRMLKISKAG